VPVVDTRPMQFRADASYLITGGLGGFGLAMAEWMVRSGARHLVLASRRGAATDEAKQAVARLQALGAEVLTPKADVSLARDVARLFRTIRQKLPPLRGILHTAMVIDDGALAQLDAERFRRVMAPKADGAWLLHRRAADLPLDFFVLFSSISALLGKAGQANYAAANCFLEALARHRRALGLPALVVSWGAIGEVGYVARNVKVADYLRLHGLVSIKPAEATSLLGRMLRNDTTHLGVFPVDWRKWTAHTPGAVASRRLEEVITASAAEAPVESGGAREAILALPMAERLPAVTAQLKGLIGKVLRTAAAKLDPSRPLNELGLDSLMSIELLERIETHFGTTLPAGNMSANTTIGKMAGDLLVLLGGATAAPVVAAPAAAVIAPVPATATAPVDCLVDLRREGRRSPLFCIHPAGGLVNIYEPLVQQLPTDRPVVGLQSRSLKSGAAEHASLASLAADYAQLIRQRQAQGPYHLVGFSVGGVFALAVAQVLEQAGQQVAFVGLIDSDLRVAEPGYLRTSFLHEHIGAMFTSLARDVELLKPLAPAAQEEVVAQLVAAMIAVPNEAWPATATRWLIDHGHIQPRMPSGLLHHYLTLFCNHAGLLQGFVPPALRAPLAVWHASEPRRAADNWAGRGVKLLADHVLVGEHYDLMHPPLVNTLAAQLSAVLTGLAPA